MSSPGGFLAFLGWTIAGLGVLACFFTLDRLADASQFADLEFADYILSLQGPLVTTGIGLIAAATGHLLSRQSRP